MRTAAALTLTLVIGCAPKASAQSQDVAALEARIAQLESLVSQQRVTWDGPTPKMQLGGVCGAERYCLGTASVVRQDTGSPAGGPQALEGYTIVANPAGTVIGHASGTIGNLELAGAGDVLLARSLTTGIIINGPGRITEATTLNLFVGRKQGYTGPVNIGTLNFIKFPNGWTLRGPLDGSYMELCDQDGRCRRM